MVMAYISRYAFPALAASGSLPARSHQSLKTWFSHLADAGSALH
jgi:hypothetical protein